MTTVFERSFRVVLFGLALVTALALTGSVHALSVSVVSPTENTVVTPGTFVLVRVRAWNPVYGISLIGCQGEGDISQQSTFGTYPLVNDYTESFYYLVPSGAGPGQTLTISAWAEGHADSRVNTTRHVVTASAPNTATPTPTRTPTATPNFESVTYEGTTIHDAVYDSDRDLLYMTNYDNNRVDIVNVATKTIDGSITVGTSPRGIDITADKSKLYVANQGSDTVSVIDLNTQTETLQIPLAPLSRWGDAYNLAVGLNYAVVGADDQWDKMARIDLSDNSISLVTQPFSVFNPAAVESSRDKRYVIYSDTGLSSTDAFVFDASQGVMVKELSSVYGYSYTLDVNEDGSCFAVSAKVLTTWDGATIGTLPSYSKNPHFIGGTPYTMVAFNSSSSSYPYSYLRFFDDRKLTSVGSIPALPSVYLTTSVFIESTDDGSVLFLIGGGKVYFVDVPSLATGIETQNWTAYE